MFWEHLLARGCEQANEGGAANNSLLHTRPRHACVRGVHLSQQRPPESLQAFYFVVLSRPVQLYSTTVIATPRSYLI